MKIILRAFIWYLVYPIGCPNNRDIDCWNWSRKVIKKKEKEIEKKVERELVRCVGEATPLSLLWFSFVLYYNIILFLCFYILVKFYYYYIYMFSLSGMWLDPTISTKDQTVFQEGNNGFSMYLLLGKSHWSTPMLKILFGNHKNIRGILGTRIPLLLKTNMLWLKNLELEY